MKLSAEEKTKRAEERKAAREAQKEVARIESEKNQKPVKSITINIEWRKSRMWGSNPHATAQIEYKDGGFDRANATASGCGYDKESTVIASIFNQFLKYKLWALSPEQIKGGHGSSDNGPAPYGITNYSKNHRSFGGGIGTNCYFGISEYIGGMFERIASGKAFDVYKYTDND